MTLKGVFRVLRVNGDAMKSIFLILVTFSTLEYEMYHISGSFEEKKIFTAAPLTLRLHTNFSKMTEIL